MVVLQGMRLAVAGMLTGIAAALLLTRYLQGLLFGVDARDPLIFAGVPLLLGLVALLAVWIPSHRVTYGEHWVSETITAHGESPSNRIGRHHHPSSGALPLDSAVRRRQGSVIDNLFRLG